MQAVLVIGGAGFIGSALVKSLELTKPIRTVVLDNMTMGNLLSEATQSSSLRIIEGQADDCRVVRKALIDSAANLIFHLAANSDIAKSASDPEIDVRDTFATTAALALELSRNPRPDCTLIFSSTSAVFGEQQGQIGITTKKLPSSSYGWMKLASEKLLKQLAESGAIGKLVIVRFPNVTGEGQTHGVVKDLVAKYLGDDPWVILGDGSQEKPYIHVSDLVSVLAQVDEIFTNPGVHELNLAPDTSTTVAAIAEMIESVGGLKRAPAFGQSPQGWPGDVSRYSYDTTHLKELRIKIPPSDEAVLRSIKDEFEHHGQ